jgi:hypothetical protein
VHSVFTTQRPPKADPSQLPSPSDSIKRLGDQIDILNAQHLEAKEKLENLKSMSFLPASRCTSPAPSINKHLPESPSPNISRKASKEKLDAEVDGIVRGSGFSGGKDLDANGGSRNAAPDIDTAHNMHGSVNVGNTLYVVVFKSFQSKGPPHSIPYRWPPTGQLQIAS